MPQIWQQKKHGWVVCISVQRIKQSMVLTNTNEMIKDLSIFNFVELKFYCFHVMPFWSVYFVIFISFETMKK